MAVWLNEAEIRANLPMSELIPAMANALRAYSSGLVNQPVRTVIEVNSDSSFFATMPAYAPGFPALGAKLVTVFGANAERGLPSHLATILLLDPDTGALLAIMDGRYITQVRTAAVSAVAADLLSPIHARVLALIGSGVQARSHLDALSLTRKFEAIRCWSPRRAHVLKFVDESMNSSLQSVESAEEAVREADVVVLVTDSPDPVLRSEWVKEGACVISVGACRPNQREMDPELVARSRLFVDSRASALYESGDVVLGIKEGRFGESHIIGELGEVLENPDLAKGTGVTVFKSLGLAVEDLAAAHLAYTWARSSGRGVPLD